METLYKGIMLLIAISAMILSHNSHADFNTKYAKQIDAISWAADKVEIPRDVLLAVCFGESSFRTKVTHIDGDTLSHGICQVKLSTAQYMDKVFKHKLKATGARLEDIRINAFYAAKYLKYQLNRYDWNIKLAVDAYNKHNARGEHTAYVKKFNKCHKLILAQVNL